VGEINSGETRWYRQPVEADEALAVEATLQRVAASQLLGDSGEDDVQYSNEGEFSVQIYDEDLDPIGGEYRSTMQASIDDESSSPRVGASMAFSGEGEIPPSTQGEVYLAITWTSPTEEAAEVQFIADIIPRYPDGVYAPTPLPEPPDSGPEPQAAEDSTGGGAAVKWLSFAGAVTLLLVAGGWWFLRRRRRT
jgi:LPXTG-motif cell wall-anchored protein